MPSFTFLGSGSSTGIPIIGCLCKACTSLSPYNKRLRPAGFIEVGDKKFLVDAGPDVRYQLLREKIDHIDGLILTHAHYDHIGGLDELRVFFFKHQQPLPCLISQATYEEVQKRYDYLFRESKGGNYTARFDFDVIEGLKGEKNFLGLPISYVTFYQGGMEVKGYRIGSFAYICDIREYDEAIFEALKGVKTLIISALRKAASHVHLNLDEAIAFGKKVGAQKTYFTHIAHEVEHEEISKELPEGFFLGFDGLKIDFSMESL